MTVLTEDKRTLVIATSQAQYFYFYMAVACVAVAFLGFAPTYWMPMASRKLPPMPMVHFHGLLFFAWKLYFVFQSWLAASGQIARRHAAVAFPCRRDTGARAIAELRLGRAA